ncbi:hypothetical protein MUP37_04055 [Candidatus Bathyarchaeota archaeon]|nr:hypothetical protein [Candidatus Bathyarchaeota archaeon]
MRIKQKALVLSVLIGVLLIALGIVALLIPLILESGGKILDAIPPIILYVYRRDGFTFVTSPILIIVSILLFILHLANKRM